MTRPPPSGTLPHSRRTSGPQDWRTSLISWRGVSTTGGGGAGGGAAMGGAAAGGAATGGGATGGRAAAGGLAAGGGAAAGVWAAGGVAGADGVAAGAAGVVAGAAGAAAGAGAVVGAAAAPLTAPTADRHAGDSFAMFCCRQASAAGPPGWTPAQFARKSEGQAERIAAPCAWVGCWACAGTQNPARARTRMAACFEA